MANTFRKVYKKSYTPGGNPTYELVRTVGVNDVELDLMKGCTHINDGELGLVPKPVAGKENAYLRGDGEWAELNIPTYTTMTGCSSSKDGVRGLVPQPMKGQQNLFLAGDGNFKKPSLGIKTNSDTGAKTLAMNVGSETISEVDILSAITKANSKNDGIMDSIEYNTIQTLSDYFLKYCPLFVGCTISDEIMTETYAGDGGGNETHTITFRTPARDDGLDPISKLVYNGIGTHKLYPFLTVAGGRKASFQISSINSINTVLYADNAPDGTEGYFYEHTIVFGGFARNITTSQGSGTFKVGCQLYIVETNPIDEAEIYTYPTKYPYTNKYTKYDPNATE